MADGNPNSVLTSKQREFLRKSDQERQEEYSRQARSYHQKEIRERARQAFYDLSLLYEHLDISERNEIFYLPREERPELHTKLVGTIAFLYHFLEGDIDDPRPEGWRLPFSEVVEPGVRLGEKGRHPRESDVTVDVDLTVEVETKPITIQERAIEELAKGNIAQLSDAELRVLVKHATRETIRDGGVETTIDGEPLEEALDDYHAPDLHGLAKAVEERAEELEKESDE